MKLNTLLIEFITEELPPNSLKELGEKFGQLITQELQEKNLVKNSDMRVFSTPRRLGVKILNVADRSDDKKKLIKLMPEKIGFDAKGQCSQALSKKLQSLNESDEAITRIKRKDEKGQTILYIEKNIAGINLEDILSQIINNCINQLPIKKMMSYQLADGWSSVNFVRPIKNLLILHGEKILKVSFLGFEANNKSFGHRFESKEKLLNIDHADNYEKILLDIGGVIANFNQRKEKIYTDIILATKSFKEEFHIIDDESLLNEVTALVEMPNILIGSFEEKFLKIPQECLILTMKVNQKYFPLFDKNNQLTNHFIIVSNLTPNDPINIIQGNEKVIRPRLADAGFFFEQDKKQSLKSLSKRLNSIVYHNKLGTQEERAGRVGTILKYIAKELDFKSNIDYKEFALISKADLLSLMVGEFPALQGVMGAIYASEDIQFRDIASAIEDHYKPKFSGDSLPRNLFGDYAALAEKFETLIGLFSINEQPTGDKDPFSLRRNAIGLIRILIEKNISLNFSNLIDKHSPKDKKDSMNILKEFIYERLSNYLKDKNFSSNEIDAVISLKPQRLNDIIKKLEAIKKFSTLEQSKDLASANKRVSNILKKYTGSIGNVDESLLKEAEEIQLFKVITKLNPLIKEGLGKKDFIGALNSLVDLKNPIDEFFENVMVNSESERIKINRHNLLKHLHISLNSVADISKLAN
ncbi:glycine--tRNA ligase subunit beta [Methylophilaceae bacterium]|nr:glycine--tRNA ligase subunit beta [Methylophilaceae bacterium]